MKKIFLIIVVLLTSVSANAQSENDGNLRVLYWNIQNGMWAEQDKNYDNFVEWTKQYNPDVCVWCEAQSNYAANSSARIDEKDAYLPEHWAELAARYGHKYIAKSGHRDHFPQVITSKYPIETLKTIVGNDTLIVAHGAGLFQININGNLINFVTLHLWPQKYAYSANDKDISTEENSGDKYRLKEIRYICEHTILDRAYSNCDMWLMMGDFNARTPLDNDIYKYPKDDSRLFVHNYILKNTPYVDVIKSRYPNHFVKSTHGWWRIDFVYANRTIAGKIVFADILYDDYCGKQTKTQYGNFWSPSDHLPILVDFDLGKR